MSTISGPKALVEYILQQSKKKASKCFLTLLMQGFLAGLYIAIGAIGSLKLSASITSPGLGDFLGAVVFPLGIIAIILMQAELFTSDCMVMTAVYSKRTRLSKVFRILFIILGSNMLGGIFASLLTKTAGIFNEATVSLVIDKAIHKVHMPVGQLLISSILCNIIVCTGVCLSYSCKDEIAKIVSIWLAITVFVISGTEHVVANVYYLFTALFYGADLSFQGIFYNLVIAAIGNFIGGGIIVSGINYLISRREL
ncbi:MAG: formate/nitrite transporter family protein [Clostridiales bacterium]|nr:formate/nitrite transporter family protein [Clostridiales bacterium]